MHRVLIVIIALLPLLFVSDLLHRAVAQAPKDAEVKKAQLKSLHTAYAAFTIKNMKAPAKIADLPLEKDAVKELKTWLDFGYFGYYLPDIKKGDESKIPLVFEKEAPKNGGLVLFYDGSVRMFSAADLKKHLEELKKDK